MEAAMDNCFQCKKLFLESVLIEAKVKDNAGYVTKLFCKSCMQEIELRSVPPRAVRETG